MLDKKLLKALAQAERMMDAGEIPWVWAPSLNNGYERLSVAPGIMEAFELEQGQTVNSFIVNAIAELSLKILKLKIEEVKQEMEDEQLTDDFDYRSMM